MTHDIRRYARRLARGALAWDGCRFGVSVLAILVVEDRAQAVRAAGELGGAPYEYGWWHPAEVAGDGGGPGVFEVTVRVQRYHGHRAVVWLEAVGDSAVPGQYQRVLR